MSNNKQIINGVDVSGCEYTQNEIFSPTKLVVEKCETRCRANGYDCKSLPNCHFKQCARKDERIRELEQKLSQIGALANEEFKFTHSERANICLQQIKQIAQGE